LFLSDVIEKGPSLKRARKILQTHDSESNRVLASEQVWQNTKQKFSWKLTSLVVIAADAAGLNDALHCLLTSHEPRIEIPKIGCAFNIDTRMGDETWDFCLGASTFLVHRRRRSRS
jgi:hypothetical protein